MPTDGQLGRVFFETNSTRIDASGQATLDELASMMKSSPNFSVVVRGHADVRGTASYDKSLGGSRAQAVISCLSQAGVEAERLALNAIGAIDESDYATARRVDFMIVAD